MDMAHFWKKVMSGLEVQPSEVPGDEAAAARELRRGLNLVPHPFRAHHLAKGRMFDLLHGMGQLENYAEDYSHDARSDEVERPHDAYTVIEAGDYEGPRRDSKLPGHQEHELQPPRPRERPARNFPAPELFEVVVEVHLRRQ